MIRLMRGCATGMALLVQTASADLSQPVLVDSDAKRSHWVTVFTNAVRLTWDWPSGSTQAGLEIVGMNGSFATNLTSATSNVLWQAFASDAPAEEDVYGLTLTFYTNGTGVVEVMTARVAVVKGAFGGTSVNADADSAAWSKVKANAVIPYDALWTGDANAASPQIVIAKVGGAVQTNVLADVSGYMGWTIRNSGWGYGTFDLSLTFGGVTNEWTAELLRPLDGTLVKMR